MEIPVTFEAKENSSSLLTDKEKSLAENRPRGFSDPVKQGRVLHYPKSQNIPIHFENDEVKKRNEGKGIRDQGKDREFLSKSNFSSSSPMRDQQRKVSAEKRGQKTSEAYFEIPIRYEVNKNVRKDSSGDKRKQDLEKDKKSVSPSSGISSGSISREDEEPKVFTPEKPRKISEVSFEIRPDKTMVQKSEVESGKETKEMQEDMEKLYISSSSASRETCRQEVCRQEVSGSEGEKTSYTKSEEFSESETTKHTPDESAHLAYTRDEVGVMREQISKLEKIAGVMKTAAVVWSQLTDADLPEETKSREQELKAGEEMLTKCLLDLDGIDSDGNEQIRCERKKAVKAVESLLKGLDEQLKTGEKA